VIHSPPQHIEATLPYYKEIASWKFDVWAYQEEQLIDILYLMFEELGYIEDFNLNSFLLRQFLNSLRQHYLPNPYHNFHHAVEVTQFIFKILYDRVLEGYLDKEEQFILFLAALCHDIGHPGRNNSFQRKTKSTIYLLFGGQSTLEHYHASLGLRLLSALIDTASIEPLFCSFILGTDPTFYSKDLPNLKDRVDLGIILLRCADLNHKIRPQPICDHWVQLLDEEFFLQGDDEIAFGLPVSHYMTRNDPASAPKNQVYFIENVCVPYFEFLAASFPPLEELRTRAQQNLLTWKNRAQTN
jgi:hypothetical protein